MAVQASAKQANSTVVPAAELAPLRRTVELLTSRIHQLEEENHALAEKLRRHGVEVVDKSRINLELPAPLTQAIDKAQAILPYLTPGERQLAEELWGDAELFLFSRSETPVDVGNWLRRAPLCAAALAGELLIFAAGKNPYLEKVAFRNLQRSLYNHITGELVLAPAPSLRHRRLKMAPAEGYQFLAQIYHGEGEQA